MLAFRSPQIGADEKKDDSDKATQIGADEKEDDSDKAIDEKGDDVDNDLSLKDGIEVMKASLDYFKAILEVAKLLTVSFPVVYAFASFALSIGAIFADDPNHEEIMNEFAKLSASVKELERKIDDLGDATKWEATKLQYRDHLGVLNLAATIVTNVASAKQGSELHGTYVRMLSDTCSNQRCQLALLSLFDGIAGTDTVSNNIFRTYIDTTLNPIKLEEFGKEIYSAILSGVSAYTTYELAQYGKIGSERVEKVFGSDIAKLAPNINNWISYAKSTWWKGAYAYFKDLTIDMLNVEKCSNLVTSTANALKKRYPFSEWYCLCHYMASERHDWNHVKLNGWALTNDKGYDRIVCFYFPKWQWEKSPFGSKEQALAKKFVLSFTDVDIEWTWNKPKRKTYCSRIWCHRGKEVKDPPGVCRTGKCMANKVEQRFYKWWPHGKLFGVIVWSQHSGRWGKKHQFGVDRQVCTNWHRHYVFNWCVLVAYISKPKEVSAQTSQTSPTSSKALSISREQVSSMILQDEMERVMRASHGRVETTSTCDNFILHYFQTYFAPILCFALVFGILIYIICKLCQTRSRRWKGHKEELSIQK